MPFPARKVERRDLTANLLSEVCHSVSTEPHLYPISGETHTGALANVEDGAGLDILANGFWMSRFERAFFTSVCSILMLLQTGNPS